MKWKLKRRQERELEKSKAEFAIAMLVLESYKQANCPISKRLLDNAVQMSIDAVDKIFERGEQ